MRNKGVRRRTKLIIETLRLTKDSQATQAKIAKTTRNEFNLTDGDKITYIKAIDGNNNILEVVNVSYEIKTKEEWVTILRYDSEHGFLHCHIRLSLSDAKEAVTTDHVIKKGTPHKWLTWAINDIKTNYLQYRKGFVKRSKLIDIGY